MSCELNFPSFKTLEKAITKKEVFLFLVHHPHHFQFVCLCVRWAVDQHAGKGDSSQPLPFFSFHARKCAWRRKRMEGIGRTHPGVKFTHDCWRPSSAPPAPSPIVFIPLSTAILLSCNVVALWVQMRISALAHGTVSTTGGLYHHENPQSCSHEPSSHWRAPLTHKPSHLLGNII